MTQSFNAEKCKEAWHFLLNYYDANSEVTTSGCCVGIRFDAAGAVNKLVAKYGKANVYTLFSTISNIKSSDGRIYGKNRAVMNSTPYIVECTNRYDFAHRLDDMDHIHTSVLNSLIGELLLLDKERN